MELEAPDAVMLYQPPRLAHAVLPAGRIDARERNHHVRMLGRELGNLLVRHRLLAASALAVDREDDAGHAPLAVVLGDLRHRRSRRIVLEVLLRGVLEFARGRIVRLADRRLDVGVNVERDDRIDIDAGSAAHTSIPWILLTASFSLRIISSMSRYSGTAMPLRAAGLWSIAFSHRSRCGSPSIDTPDHLYVRTHGQCAISAIE